MPIGPGKTTAGLGGSIPQVTHVGTTRIKQKQLFISHRDIALMMDYTFKGGYGVLEAGTLMCQKFDDDVASDILIPFALEADDANLSSENPAISMLTSNAASTALEVALVDSYKFAVGDTIVLAEGDTPSYEVLTIAAIVVNGDRAEIETGAFTATAFTTANSAHIFVKGDLDAGNTQMCKAIAILDMDLDTGLDINPGALGNVVVSNCILRKDAMMAYDAQALTDLGAEEKYSRIIIK